MQLIQGRIELLVLPFVWILEQAPLLPLAPERRAASKWTGTSFRRIINGD